MFVETIRIESLSNNSYVVGSEQSGRCVVIDPARDVDQYVQIAAKHGTRIVYAFETHVHNDFVSGVRELSDQTGCQIGASASGGLLFPSARLQENDGFDLGEFQFRILHTPGHTPDSISFLVEEQGRPTAIFTGGALMLGGAARVDLLGSKIAPFLARWLHNTIHEKLLKLPDSRNCSLTALSVRNHLDNEGVLVDARPVHDFNIGHVPGSFAVPHGNSMATWVGWVVPWGQPLVLLSADASHHDDMVRQLIRIGFDRVHGFLAGGIEAWKSAGLPVEVSNTLDLDSLRQAQDLPAAPMVIDVRQRNEYAGGHISGALNIELGELQDHLDGLPRELPLVTVCAAGMRATTAGSILQRDGRENVQVVDEAGTPAWIERGYPSETGAE